MWCDWFSVGMHECQSLRLEARKQLVGVFSFLLPNGSQSINFRLSYFQQAPLHSDIFLLDPGVCIF